MTIPRYGGALDLFVRGYTLPNDYFYKGNIEIKESYDDDVDIDKEKNIQAILEKIKQAHDTDTIMKEPEDDSDMVLKKEQETSTRHSRSDYELSVAATVITGQLEELMDRIISEHSFVAKSTRESTSSLGSDKSNMTSTQSVKSVTDIKSLLKKSLSRFASVGAISVSHQQLFNFSELDDGSVGKASVVGVNSTKKIFHDFKQIALLSHLNKQVSKEKPRTSSASEEIILQATTKLINFISKKEKEYFYESHESRS